IPPEYVKHRLRDGRREENTVTKLTSRHVEPLCLGFAKYRCVVWRARAQTGPALRYVPAADRRNQLRRRTQQPVTCVSVDGNVETSIFHGCADQQPVTPRDQIN